MFILLTDLTSNQSLLVNINRKSRKGARRRVSINKSPSIRMTNPYRLGDSPSFRGQPILRIRIPCAPIKFSTTITTGVIASNIGINITLNTNFSSTYANLFDEYRILGCSFKLIPLGVNSGITSFFFQEKITSSPTNTEATSKPLCALLSNNSASSKDMKIVSWRARDLLDLQYNSVASTVTPAGFCIYTDAASFGSPVSVTPLWLVYPTLDVEFRGLLN